MENIARRPGRPRGLLADKLATQTPEPAEIRTDELRPAMRDEDPRAKAARRAQELRGHLGNIDEGTDRFYIDPDTIPDGWTYNWKRFSSTGQDDLDNQRRVKREGWTTVPVSRYPDMMPQGTDPNDMIIIDGLVLMECPTEIVEERRSIELRRARQQVMYKEQQLAGTPEGTLTRDHAKVRPQIKKSYAAMPIPEE